MAKSKIGLYGPVEEVSARFRVVKAERANQMYPETHATLESPEYLEEQPFREVQLSIIGFPAFTLGDEYEVIVRKVQK